MAERTGHFEPPAGTDQDAPRFAREDATERPVRAEADTPQAAPDARRTPEGQLAAEQAEIPEGASSGKALASLICGGLGIVTSFVPILGWVLGAIAVALGVMGRSDARRGQRGGSRATIGFVLGVIAIVAATAFFVGNVVAVA